MGAAALPYGGTNGGVGAVVQSPGLAASVAWTSDVEVPGASTAGGNPHWQADAEMPTRSAWGSTVDAQVAELPKLAKEAYVMPSEILSVCSRKEEEVVVHRTALACLFTALRPKQCTTRSLFAASSRAPTPRNTLNWLPCSAHKQHSIGFPWPCSLALRGPVHHSAPLRNSHTHRCPHCSPAS
jgi:hypothetical protein